MKGILGLAASIVVALLLLAASAVAEEGVPSRTEYVGQVEPICEANTACQ